MSFNDALDAYRPPASSDLDIMLPSRREPKKEPAAAPADNTPDLELGQHGGSSDEAAAAASSTEPEPQRDDPDDGEHTDSTQEQLAARARKSAPEPGEQPVVKESVSPDALTEETTFDAADVGKGLFEAVETDESEAPPLPRRARVAAAASGEPRAFRRVAFSAGDDTPTLLVKRFPQPIIDKLRSVLLPALGAEMVENLSATALLTAYLTTALGVDLELDENTMAAAEAYRFSDTRLAAVEDRVEDVLSGIDQLGSALKMSLTRVAETGTVVDSMEFALAFLVADRVAGLATVDVDETNVDVTQKKVLAARQTIRVRSKAQRTIEKQRDRRTV